MESIFDAILTVFSFVDHVSEVKEGQSVTATFMLKGNEEFLLDHFDGFPVMPGVLLLESLKQTALKLLEKQEGQKAKYRISKVHEVKFGQFVKPKTSFQLSVHLTKQTETQAEFDGKINLLKEDGSVGSRALMASFVLTRI